MCIDEINIDDIVCYGIFGYKVLDKSVQNNLVRVCTVYKFKDRSCRTIVEKRINGETHTVTPDCFSRKYVTKAVIL